MYFRKIITTCANNNALKTTVIPSSNIHTTHKICKDAQSESPIKKLLDDSASFEDAKASHPQQQWATHPYPDGAKIRRQGDFYAKNKRDPRESSIILFPGQGYQYVGMAKDLMKFPMARDLFELASYILKYDLLKVCLEGPQNKLDRTTYCQPAVMVSSLAALEKLKEERPNAIENCVGTAGFSLGEFAALVFAGALEFEEALKLVQIRAEAMQMACDVTKGAMARVVFGPDSNINYACLKAKEWAADKGVEQPECSVANYLFPHCKVVAGNIEAIEFIEKNVKELKLRHVKRLPVNGAFHCELMRPAVDPFRRAINKIKISDPIISVYNNIDGKRYRDADQIRKFLPKHIVKPVKWEQLLHVVYEREPGEHFPRTFECGPGNSLKTILKQVNAKAWDTCFTIEA